MSKDYKFDPETGRFNRVLPAGTVTAQPVIPVDTEFVPVQPEDDSFAYTPGGDDGETLSPPQTFYVPAGTDGQQVRINPDGSVVVDVIIQIDDADNTEYEVRVTT